jgi:hypothetical protein
MQTDGYPNKIGSRVSYQWSSGSGDTPNEAATAILTEYLSGGTTAWVFKGKVEGDTEDTVVVKLSKPGENHSKEWEALSVLRKTAAGRNVPRAGLGTLLAGETVVVMEYLPPGRQWLNLRNEDRLSEAQLYEAARQAAALLAEAQKAGFVNLDIKHEVYYWLSEGRTVHRDWNRLEWRRGHTSEGDSNKGFRQARIEAVKSLLKLVFLTLTGQHVPFPPPSLGASKPEAWMNAPWVLQRAILDAWSEDGLSESEAETRFAILTSAARHEWNALLDRAESWIESSAEDLRAAVNQVRDVVWVLSEDTTLGEVDLERLDRLEKWLEDSTGHSQVEAACKRVIGLIKSLDFVGASDIAQNSIQKLPVPLKRCWPLAVWHAVATECARLVDAGVLIQPEPLIDSFLKDTEAPLHLLGNDAVIQAFVRLREQIQESEKVRALAQGAYRAASAQSRLEKFMIVRERLEVISLPEPALKVLRARLPTGWDDFPALEMEAAAETRYVESAEKIAQACNLLEHANRDTRLGEFVQEVQRIVNEPAGNVAARADMAVLTIQRANRFAIAGQWRIALDLLPAPAISGLVARYRERLLQEIQYWLESLDHRIIYAPDLEQIMRLKEWWQENIPAEANELFNRLNSRLVIALDARQNRYNHHALSKCHDAKVEPWMLSGEGTAQSVEFFLRVLDFEEAAKLRVDLDRGVDELNQFLLGYGPELDKKLAGLTTKIQDARNNLHGIVETKSKADSVLRDTGSTTNSLQDALLSIQGTFDELQTTRIEADALIHEAEELRDGLKEQNALTNKAEQDLRGPVALAGLILAKFDDFEKTEQQLQNRTADFLQKEKTVAQLSERAQIVGNDLARIDERTKTSNSDLSQLERQAKTLQDEWSALAETTKGIKGNSVAAIENAGLSSMSAAALAAALGYVAEQKWDDAERVLEKQGRLTNPFLGKWRQEIDRLRNADHDIRDLYAELLREIQENGAPLERGARQKLQSKGETLQPLFTYLTGIQPLAPEPNRSHWLQGFLPALGLAFALMALVVATGAFLWVLRPMPSPLLYNISLAAPPVVTEGNKAALRAIVTSADGKPVSDVDIEFVPQSGGADVEPRHARTDGAGVAQTTIQMLGEGEVRFEAWATIDNHVWRAEIVLVSLPNPTVEPSPTLVAATHTSVPTLTQQPSATETLAPTTTDVSATSTPRVVATNSPTASPTRTATLDSAPSPTQTTSPAPGPAKIKADPATLYTSPGAFQFASLPTGWPVQVLSAPRDISGRMWVDIQVPGWVDPALVLDGKLTVEAPGKDLCVDEQCSTTARFLNSAADQIVTVQSTGATGKLFILFSGIIPVDDLEFSR